MFLPVLSYLTVANLQKNSKAIPVKCFVSHRHVSCDCGPVAEWEKMGRSGDGKQNTLLGCPGDPVQENDI